MSAIRTYDDNDDEILPKINSIMQGEVLSIKDYGAFVKLPGFRKNGLVHKFQISNSSIEDVSEVLSVKDRIWVKIISVGTIDDPKISLSMKVVDQGAGKDMDPSGVIQAQEDKRKKSFNPRSSKKITLDAVYNTVCKKCGTKGHLSQDCFQRPGGKSYELLSDDEIPEPIVAQIINPEEELRQKLLAVHHERVENQHKSKKTKKSKKDKTKEKHKKKKRRSSEDDYRKSKKHKTS